MHNVLYLTVLLILSKILLNTLLITNNLNDEKTECIVFGDTVSADFGTLKLSSTVRNLGVTFDSHLKFDKQISNVVRTSFFQLRLLAKVKIFLSRHDLEKAIHALISSRLDYCNALYVGVSQSSLSRLQLVQNAAARLLTNTQTCAHYPCSELPSLASCPF